jgi:hypothetical protein
MKCEWRENLELCVWDASCGATYLWQKWSVDRARQATCPECGRKVRVVLTDPSPGRHTARGER